MTRSDRLDALVKAMAEVPPGNLPAIWLRYTALLDEVANNPVPKFNDVITALETVVHSNDTTT